MPYEYLDFDVVFMREPTGKYRAVVTSSPAGEAEHPFEWPLNEEQLENWIHRLGHARDKTRMSKSPKVELAREFGSILFGAVFEGPIGALLLGSVERARQKEMGLRIRLHLAGAEGLNDVPWEYLYSPDLNRFMVVSSETPIVRYIELPFPAEPLAVEPPLVILVLVSSPRDLPTLDVEVEWRHLKTALGDLEASGHVRLERVAAATTGALQQHLMSSRVNVLHFIGHGSYDPATHVGSLAFEKPDGSSDEVSGEQLGALLSDQQSLKLVLLNSCEGARNTAADPFAGTAQGLISQGIPGVVGMQFEISDGAATRIAHDFYRALAAGYPIDAALAEARKGLFVNTADVEWGTPVLYMRSPDGRIFDISAQATPVLVPAPLAGLPAGLRSRWLVGAAIVAALAVALIAGFLAIPSLTGRVDVPDIVGMSEVAAIRALREAELEAGTGSGRHDETAAVGLVLESSPSSGSQVDEGTAIDYVVSLGRTPVLLPDVVDSDLSQARVVLEATGVSVQVDERPTEAAPPGTILTQQPGAGEKVRPDATVTVTASVLPSTRWLYWTNPNAGTIGRVRLDGTSMEEGFVSGAVVPSDVAVDGTYVYWTNSDADTIGRARLDGGEVNQSFIRGASRPYGVAVDDTYIYWTNSDDGTIGRAMLDGMQSRQRFIKNAGYALRGVAVDNSHVYWGDAAEFDLRRAKLDGTGQVSWVANANPLDVSVEGVYVYWSNIVAVERSKTDVKSVTRDLLRVDGVGGIATDDAHLYWTEPATGNLMRSRADEDAEPEVIAQVSNPQGIAVTSLEPIVLEGHTAGLFDVTFDLEGTRIATSSEDRTVRIWDSNGSELFKIPHSAEVFDVAFSPDGSRIVTRDFSESAKLWDISGRLLAELESGGGQLMRVAFDPDGDRLVTGSGIGVVRLWDRDGGLIGQLPGHTDVIVAAEYSPTGSQLLTAERFGTTHIRDAEGAILATIKDDVRLLGALFSPGGEYVLTLSSDDTVARIWNLDGSLVSELHGHRRELIGGDWSPDGTLVVTLAGDGARVWDVDGTERLVIGGHRYVGDVVRFSPDGSEILTAGSDKTATVWDLDGHRVYTLSGHAKPIYDAEYSPAGLRIATSSDDGTARVWSTESR